LNRFFAAKRSLQRSTVFSEPDGSCSSSRARFWQRVTPRRAGTPRAADARATSRDVGDAHASTRVTERKHPPRSPARRTARVPRDLAIVPSTLPGSVPRSRTVDAGPIEGGFPHLARTVRGPRDLVFRYRPRGVFGRDARRGRALSGAFPVPGDGDALPPARPDGRRSRGPAPRVRRARIFRRRRPRGGFGSGSGARARVRRGGHGGGGAGRAHRGRKHRANRTRTPAPANRGVSFREKRRRRRYVHALRRR